MAEITTPTPGPWATDPECGDESVVDAKGFLIADCSIFGPGASEDRNRANARFIAAIHDLRAALFRLKTECEIEGLGNRAGFDCWLSMANKALAKAEGHAS